ncbi:MAG: PilZ domain-containing protein [Gammaproteobacteria bacterium]|nr:PilZ domain-containing protein [Gammaproteobacteria bacterium]
MDPKEKRRHPRLSINRPGRLQIGDGPPSLVQIANISEAGAALFYSATLALDTPVQLNFHLNLGAGKVLLEIRGRVRHSHLKGHSHMLGVEFVDTPPDTLQTLRQYIEQNQKMLEE